MSVSVSCTAQIILNYDILTSMWKQSQIQLLKMQLSGKQLTTGNHVDHLDTDRP